MGLYSGGLIIRRVFVSEIGGGGGGGGGGFHKGLFLEGLIIGILWYIIIINVSCVLFMPVPVGR